MQQYPDAPPIDFRHLDYNSYFSQIGKYKFVVAPEGNGVDTHRLWETLYAGSIPIVERNILMEIKTKGLPILWTTDYSEITEDYLNTQYTQFLSSKYNFKSMFLHTYSFAEQRKIFSLSCFWCKKRNLFHLLKQLYSEHIILTVTDPVPVLEQDPAPVLHMLREQDPQVQALALHMLREQHEQVQASQVQASQVQASQVQASQVQASQVQASQVQASQVQASQVQASQVQASQVQASQVQASQVQASQVQASQVQASQVQASQVQASQVQASQVQASQVQASQVQASEKPLKYYGLYSGERIQLDKNLDDDIFNQKTEGFYIDIGAHDGLQASNTAFLEFHRNWRGILVTPSTKHFQQCKVNRPNSFVINAACVCMDYPHATIDGNFNSINGCPKDSPLASTISQNITVSALSLNSILDRYIKEQDLCKTTIDLLKIDTYGYDLEVLKGIDLSKYNPNYILIELYDHNHDTITEYLQSNNYIVYSNLSNFTKQNKSSWSGKHNDYLFVSLLTN